jgi:YHS domain-containing protein
MKMPFAFACALVVASCVACAKESKDEKKGPEPINKVCPVEGGDVDAAVNTEHKGKTIGFCCESCIDGFKKDPVKYMAIVDKELAKAPPKKEDGSGEKKEAELNAKCPVTDDDADKSITKEYKGRTIAFCCDGCVEDFDKDPKKYIAKLEKQEKDAKKGEKPAEK